MRLRKLIQVETYAGLMAGLPNTEMNNRILDRAYTSALDYLGIKSDVEKSNMKTYLQKPVFITPDRTTQQLGGRVKELLPPYFTIAIYGGRSGKVLIIMYTHTIAEIKEINDLIASNNIDLESLATEVVW